jgi:hypothetical protein
MVDPSRGVRARRATRRPGGQLLTALLVLAVVASSALVFTNKVELLKLAVVLALWAAVAAAFVSFIYRRQADVDRARARDLKTVYNLQLDREISARREYELSVESHLRRELASELRAQSADEVAALRTELAALRTHLEILFDTDLEHRPALGEGDRSARAERVIASRIDTEDRPTDEAEPRTEESPIIDVAAEPHPIDEEWDPQPMPAAGAHRRAHESASVPPPPIVVPPPAPAQFPPAQSAPSQQAPQPAPAPPPQPAPAPPPQPVAPAASQWRPVEAEGEWIPAGVPGSNWAAPITTDERGAEPTMTLPQVPPQGRRHRVEDQLPGAQQPAAPEPPVPSEPGPRSAPSMAVPPTSPPTEPPAPRHRSAEDEQAADHRSGGQSAAELLARLQVNVGEGGRRRRHED